MPESLEAYSSASLAQNFIKYKVSDSDLVQVKMPMVSCVRLTADANVEPVAFDCPELIAPPKRVNNEVLKNLPAKLFIPQLEGDHLLGDLPGFQTVFARQSAVVEQFIILSLSLTAEGRQGFNFWKNEMGLELISQEQRAKHQLYCLLGPVLILKHPRFQVLKTESPQNLSKDEFRKYSKHLNHFNVTYNASSARQKLQLSHFLPKDSVVLAAPEPRPSKPMGKTIESPAVSKPQPIVDAWEDLYVDEFPALPPPQFPEAPTPPPGLTRMNTLERSSAAEEMFKWDLPASGHTIQEADDMSTASTALGSPASVIFSPLFWNEDDVAEWLKSLNVVYTKYIPDFKVNEINGEALKELTDAELKNDLGVKELGPRKVIYSAIQRLFAWAAGHRRTVVLLLNARVAFRTRWCTNGCFPGASQDLAGR